MVDEQYTNIDDLIAKPQELTQPKPKPKFEIGDIVWYRKDINICNIEIIYFSWDKDAKDWVCFSEDDFMCERYVYPSREALIQAQIDYWMRLKDE